MRLINKRQQPSSFQQYTRQVGVSYDDIDTNVKLELKQSLINEQFGVCAYCQQTLKELDKTTIEHHCERSICNGQNNTNDRRLDYINLFAVCLGKGGRDNVLHCDTKKATFNINNGLPMCINPTIQAHVNTIKYSSTGLISSSNDIYDTEINTILNLNAAHLKDLRKRKWIFIFKNSLNQKKGGFNKNKMKKLIEKDLVKTENKFLNSFPALSEYLENKFCSAL